MWVRLILENSTVCLISRRISLLCPVDIDVVPAAFGGGCWCRGFFDNDSGEVFSFCGGGLIASFVQSWMWLLLIVLPAALVVGGFFSMESLILAQDERWRRA